MQQSLGGGGRPSATTDGDPPVFATSRDHLRDEFRCLDLRLRRQLLRQTPPPSDGPLSPFKGLVITDAEVAGLLAPPEPAEGVAVEEQEVQRCLKKAQNEVRERRSCSLQAGIYLSLVRLAELFVLTRLEEQCILVCLAPELDRKYEKLYGYLQDDATRKKPTADLIIRVLSDSAEEESAARAVLDPGAPLLKFKLLQVTDTGADGQFPFLSRPLKLDDRIVNFLLDSRQMDSRLERFARVVRPGPGEVMTAPEFQKSAGRFLENYLQEPQSASRNLLLYLHGPVSADQRLAVEAFCGAHLLALLVADVESMLAGPLAFDQAAWLLGREAVLQSAVLCLENMDRLTAEPDKHRLELMALLDSAMTFSRITFMLGNGHWQPKDVARNFVFLSIAVPPPDLGTRKRLWEENLSLNTRVADDVDASVLAGKFRFGRSQIKEALAAAGNLARWRSPDEWRITPADVYAACRAQSSPRLGALARKIEPKYTWDEIVLPPDHLAQLKELCQQARHRHVVYGEWGFDRKLSLGKGLNALFSGPPGTGKTMAAEVVAGELQLDLHRIDLSQVVSKYIGETEKNLHQIFQEAQTGHAILFFDEADALFGKRSEVKDAHDRYANIEVGYLLQKMEEYEGVAILATNLSQNMDEAFLRRMHFVIEFPFPDQEHRRRIWQVIFPREAPLASEVDFGLLAREIRLAGGNIRNIALAAAFYAAADGRVIQMPHLWQAARREHQKLGRTWKEMGQPA